MSSVISHLGLSQKGDLYVSICKKVNQYYFYKNIDINPISLNKVLQHSPYILVYEISDASDNICITSDENNQEMLHESNKCLLNIDIQRIDDYIKTQRDIYIKKGIITKRATYQYACSFYLPEDFWRTFWNPTDYKLKAGWTYEFKLEFQKQLRSFCIPLIIWHDTCSQGKKSVSLYYL